MSTAQMLIPPAHPPVADYRVDSDDKQDRKGSPKRAFIDNSTEVQSKIPRLSPPPASHPQKPASEGFSTPPSSSSYLGAFKAPLSVPPSISFGISSCLSPEITPPQTNHHPAAFQYGSPGTPEVEDVSQPILDKRNKYYNSLWLEHELCVWMTPGQIPHFSHSDSILVGLSLPRVAVWRGGASSSILKKIAAPF